VARGVRSLICAGAAAVGILLTASCGGEAGSSPPSSTPTDGRAAHRVVAAILDRCHGKRRGTFAKSVVELRRSPADEPRTLSLDLPERMLSGTSDGRQELVRPDGAWTWPVGEPASPLDDGAREELVRLRDLLGYVFLLPLERNRNAERVAGDRLRLRDGAGEEYLLAYDPDTDTPVALSGPAGEVRFVAHFDSGVTRIPTVVELGSVGRLHLRVLETGFVFEPSVFEVPDLRPDPGTSIVLGPRIESSEVITVAPRSWLMFPDPGDWSSRMELCAAAGSRLAPKGFRNGGDPLLVKDEQGSWFVIQFLPARDDPDPVEPETGERLVELPECRLAIVRPEAGNWEERLASGRRALARLIEERGLRPSGPVRAAVNVYGKDPAARPDVLRTTPIALEQPVER
jgi:hypothetical protein